MDAPIPANCFQYKPLQPGHELRIVKILPGEDLADIRCRTSDITLDDPPPYHALSYVWGSEERKSPINVNDQCLLVTENLFVALGHLRHTETVRVFWIDAICINQSDNEEKSTQLRIMKDIYSKAKEVVIWLGPEANGSQLAMALAAKIHRYWTHQTAVLQRPESDILKISRADSLSEQLLNYGVDSSDSLEAFNLLLSRAWWERIWIIQEVTTPLNVKIIRCGDSITGWDALVTASKVTSNLASRADLKDMFENVHMNEFSNRRLFNLDNLRKKGQLSTDLLSILADFRHYKAKDPRDMVYALLGLLEEKVTEELAPNYSHDLSLVYQSAARHCILQRGALDCLGYCYYSQRNPSLPSWVPDWTHQGSRHPLAKHAERRGHSSGRSSIYHAAGPHSALLDMSNFLESKLSLKGLCVDRVKHVGRTYSKVLHGQEDAILIDWMPNDLESQYKFTGETTALAYFRTLVADVATLEPEVLQ